MNLRKRIRNLRAAGKVTKYPEAQKFLRKMTNWQNSQWLRFGAKPDTALTFHALQRSEHI